MQGRFIKLQLTPISKCYLKFNSKLPNKSIYAVHSKFLQADNFLLNNQTFNNAVLY